MRSRWTVFANTGHRLLLCQPLLLILGHCLAMRNGRFAEGYGLSFPVPLLKRWIDKIEFF